MHIKSLKIYEKTIKVDNHLIFLLLIFVAYNNIIGISEIPKNFIRGEGYSLISDSITFLFDNKYFLYIVQYFTLTLLALLMFFKNKYLFLISSFLVTIHYHIQICFTHFFHSGLILLLSFYVITLNEFLFRNREEIKLEVNINLIKLIYALSYFFAGLSKLFVYPFWFRAVNIRQIISTDRGYILGNTGFSQKIFNFFIEYDILLTVLGLFTILIELAAIILIFKNKFFKIFIPLIILLHLGIYFFQGFLFWDLILFPLIFIPIINKVKIYYYKNLKYAYILIISIMFSGWLFKIEIFPLFTKWGMYANYNHDDKAHYIEFYKKDNEGLSKINFVDKYSFLNNAKWLDFIKFPNDFEIDYYRNLLINYDNNTKEFIIYHKVFIFEDKSVHIINELLINNK